MKKRFSTIDIPRLILVDVLVLMALGTVFVFSASASVSAGFDVEHFFKSVQFRNMIYLPMAIVVLYGFSCFDYKWLSLSSQSIYRSVIFWFGLIVLAFLVLVLIPGIGTEINYARRWLRFEAGPVSINFQPSELAKWFTIIFLAGYLNRFRYEMNRFWARFMPACLIVGVICGLIVMQDFGTAAFIGLLSFLMLLIGGARLWHFLTPVPFAAAGGYFAIATSQTRINRIKAFLDPESFAGTTGYQARQSLIALGTGGVCGKGLGRGVSNYGHLPEDTTDFIFAIIGHELGFVGSVMVIMLYAGFVLLGIAVVLKCRDNFGQLLAAGIVMAIGIQAAVNIGVVTVVLPTKGIPLPFVSAGGTSLLLSAAAIGVLVNIAKQSQARDYEYLDNIEGFLGVHHE